MYSTGCIMRKFIVWLFICIILSGIIFFFGWTQFRLDKDVYGVVYTRTFGYHDEPIKSGEFSWSVWSLIPKNMIITQIPAGYRTVRIHTEDTLPSASLYSMTLVGDPDFTYEMDIRVSYAVAEHSVVSLVKSYNINEKTISSWLLDTDNKVKQVANELLSDYFQHAESDAMDSADLAESVSQYLQTKLSAYFPELDFKPIQIVFLHLPDYDLYLQAKNDYVDLIELKTSTLMKALADAPEKVADNVLYLDKLESYGELLTRYPVLIEYLELELKNSR